MRDFNSNWYNEMPWLEFSLEAKAAFCFCCRNFGTINYEDTFTRKGFQNWKTALENGKGFQKHAQSKSHTQAMSIWLEKMKRQETGQSISTLLSQNQLEKNRYYVWSIAEMIKFLAINELPFRGHRYQSLPFQPDSDTNTDSCGLFIKLFEYTLNKDVRLQECAAHIPQNTKCVCRNSK